MSDVPSLYGDRLKPDSGEAPRQLVVLLHGLGANGADLIDLGHAWAPLLPMAEFLAPNAPFDCDMGPYGYQWFSLQHWSPEALLAGVREAAPILNAYLDAELAARGLDDSHLALVGFSQGTMMALHVGLRRATAPAAIVGFSGMLVAGQSLAEDIVSRPPVLLVHGDADPVVPFAALAAAAASLRAAGVNVTTEVRPEMGHGIDAAGLALAGQFLKDKLA